MQLVYLVEVSAHCWADDLVSLMAPWMVIPKASDSAMLKVCYCSVMMLASWTAVAWAPCSAVCLVRQLLSQEKVWAFCWEVQ